MAFLLLRTVIWAWASGAEYGGEGPRRHAPQGHLRDAAAQALRRGRAQRAGRQGRRRGRTGSAARTRKHDREFFATLAVDPATYFDVFDEMKVAPDQMRDVEARQAGRDRRRRAREEARLEGRRQGHPRRAASTPATGSSTIDGIYTATAQARSIARRSSSTGTT